MSTRGSLRLRSWLRPATAVLPLVPLLAGCVTKQAYDDLSEQKAALEEVLAEKEQELASARVEADELASRNEDLARTQATYDALVTELNQELVAGQVQIEQLRDGIRVQLSQEVLFDSGSAEVDADGREVLERVSNELADVPYRIEVEGYTDSTPIGGKLAEQFPSNWELAAARSSQVVRLLEEAGIDADRLVALSYGDTRALVSNADPQGRAQNRRIEIRLIPIGEEAAALPAVASPPPDTP